MEKEKATTILKYIEYCNSIWGKRREELICRQLEPYIRKDFKILDLGCGLGRISLKLSENCRQVIAVDISKEMLEELSIKKVAFKKLNIKIIQNDFIDYIVKSPQNQFDLILCHNSLEYINEDKLKLFEILFKCVKNNGYLSVVIINRYGEVLRMARRGRWQEADLLNKKSIYYSNTFKKNIYLYDSEEAKNLMEKANWKVNKIYGVGIIDDSCYKKELIDSINEEIRLSSISPYKEQAILSHLICSKNNIKETS